jgi:hypothetical protein
MNGTSQFTAWKESRECGGALGSYESVVMVEKSYYVFGRRIWTASRGVFEAKASQDDLKIQWIDDHRLAVTCRCKDPDVIFHDDSWRGVTFTYAYLP